MDPDPYLLLMDPDTDPAGHKHVDPVDPDPDSNTDPQHRFWIVATLFSRIKPSHAKTLKYPSIFTEKKCKNF